jgi:hypothetical protein
VEGFSESVAGRGRRCGLESSCSWPWALELAVGTEASAALPMATSFSSGSAWVAVAGDDERDLRELKRRWGSDGRAGGGIQL